MAQMIDTSLPSNTNKKLLRAFLYGIIDGEYKIYESDESTLSIWFKIDEEATLFVMRELEAEFIQNFLSTTDDLDDILEQLRKMPPLTAPSPYTSPYTSPMTPWYPGTTFGGDSSVDDYKKYIINCDLSENSVSSTSTKLL